MQGSSHASINETNKQGRRPVAGSSPCSPPMWHGPEAPRPLARPQLPVARLDTLCLPSQLDPLPWVYETNNRTVTLIGSIACLGWTIAPTTAPTPPPPTAAPPTTAPAHGQHHHQHQLSSAEAATLRLAKRRSGQHNPSAIDHDKWEATDSNFPNGIKPVGGRCPYGYVRAVLNALFLSTMLNNSLLGFFESS